MLMAACARREAVDFFDQGNVAKAELMLQSSGQILCQMSLSTPAMAEAEVLDDLSTIFSLDAIGSSKRAKSQAFHISRGRRSSRRQKNKWDSDRCNKKYPHRNLEQ